MGAGASTQSGDSELQALRTEADNILKDKNLDKKTDAFVEVETDRYERIIRFCTKIAHGSGDRTPEVLPEVQIINSTPTDATTIFVDKFSKRLAENSISTKFKTIEADQFDSSIFTIIVCNSDPADVKSCLDELAGEQYSSIIFILLYVTREDNLEQLRLKTNLAHYNIPETFVLLEMAFTTKEGIYPCQINTSTVEKILRCLKKNPETKRKNDNNEKHGKKVKNCVEGIKTDVTDKYSSSVFIVDPDPTQASELFVTELKEKLRKYKVELTEGCLTEEQRNTNVFTILICNNHSRINSDMQKSLHKVKAEQYERTIVVVLHVKREKQLPSNRTTNEVEVKDSEHKGTSIKAFIDMAYTQDDKIYECKMNKTAFEDLGRILNVNMSEDASDRETNGGDV